MPINDALLFVHGTPPATAAAWLTAGSQYSTNELDFGAPVAGTSTTSPLPEFPSLTEKTYSPPAATFGGNVEWGLHFVVGVVFDTLTSFTLDAVSNSTTNATTVIASRTITLAQAVAGAHFFLPIPTQAVLEFLRAHSTLTGSNNVGGTAFMWFGPRTGGEL